MNKDKLIKKWLDHNLTPNEVKAFEALDDANELNKLNSALNNFKAIAYDTNYHYDEINHKITHLQSKKSWWRPLLKIAAIFVIGLSIFYYTVTKDTHFNTEIAERNSMTLPDSSTVELNAMSSLSYNSWNWDKDRTINLEGEAFFKVAKGKSFKVYTKDGLVTVLGTQFNVKQRHNYFEVYCFEGVVEVKYKTKTKKLKPGEYYRFIDGNFIAEKEKSSKLPGWLNGESVFKKTPLRHVISELENQYNITIIVENINLSRLYTGSFPHNNLNLALKAVTTPLELDFKESNNSIIFMRD